MKSSTVTCMVVDLKKKEISCQEWNRSEMSDELGTYGIYLNELESVWRDNPDAIALAAGPLTGMAVPGAGGMSWCRKEGEGFLLEHTEGRLGAALRCAQIDHLIIKGVSSERIDLMIEDGKAEFKPVSDDPEGDLWQQLLKERPEMDSVTALMDEDGVKEDPYFLIGSGELSGCMKEKGIRALVVTGRGSLEVSQPEEMLKQSLSLCKSFQKGLKNAGGRKQPARYLSVNHIWNQDEEEINISAPLAFLGLGWDEEFPVGDIMETAAFILNAYTGACWDGEKLLKVKDQVERGMK